MPRPVTVTAVLSLSHLDLIVKIFHESNVRLIAVTDGFDHPHKLETKIRGADLALENRCRS